MYEDNLLEQTAPDRLKKIDNFNACWEWMSTLVDKRSDVLQDSEINSGDAHLVFAVKTTNVD